MARTNFYYLLVSTSCSGLLVFSALYFSRFPLGMAASTLGRLHAFTFFAYMATDLFVCAYYPGEARSCFCLWTAPSYLLSRCTWP